MQGPNEHLRDVREGGEGGLQELSSEAPERYSTEEAGESLRGSIWMKRAFVWTGILACSFLPAFAYEPDVAELDPHLRFLEPLIGHQWEGGYVGEGASDLVISLSFEAVLEGKAVKYTRSADP